MSIPQPNNAHTPGAPQPPSASHSWPGPQGAALRGLTSMGEIIRQAFAMPWTQARVLLVWVVVVPSAANFLVHTLSTAITTNMYSGLDAGSISNMSGLGYAGLSFLISILSILVSIAIAAFVPAFIAENIRSLMLGYRAKAREIWSTIRRVIWRILGYTVLLGLAIGIGGGIAFAVVVGIFAAMLAIAAGGPSTPLLVILMVLFILAILAVVIWLTIKLVFVPSAIIFEGATIQLAMSRSWNLTKGRFWRTFGTLLLIGLAFVLVISIVNLIVMGSFFGSLRDFTNPSTFSLTYSNFSVLTLLSNLITDPLLGLSAAGGAIASTLLYLDARTKTERLDLTLENWQQAIRQGFSAQQLQYPFATPVATPYVAPGFPGAPGTPGDPYGANPGQAMPPQGPGWPTA